jgi:hypothetical protein
MHWSPCCQPIRRKKVIQHVQERYANVQSKYKKQLHTIYSIYLEKVQPNSAQLIFELNEKRQLKKLLSFIHSLFPKKYSSFRTLSAEQDRAQKHYRI